MTEEKLAVQEKIKEKVEVLRKDGGFKILEGVIDGKKGIRELNPKDEARRTAFLTDEDKAEKRKALKAELEILKELVQMDNLEEAITASREKSQKAGKVLHENLTDIFEKTRDLEKSYRSMDLFFRNAETENIGNLFFINMPTDEFRSQDNANLREEMTKHFDQNFDRFSLEDNYSLLVIPGFLGENLEYWSKVASKYRITLVTDFEDKFEFADIQDDGNTMAGDDKHLANALVTCNYGIIRKKIDGIENDDLAIPLSVVLSGKMYNGNGIQPSAGKKFGKLDGVLGTRINLLRTEATEIDQMGMVPVIFEKSWGTVAMSDTTLCADSADPDMRAIGVVRAKDWIAKVLLDYFNGLAFENFNAELREEIKEALNNFFNSIKGPGKLIESYEIVGPKQDPKNPQIVQLGVNVKPYFAAKHYVIDFSGTQNRFKAKDKE